MRYGQPGSVAILAVGRLYHPDARSLRFSEERPRRAFPRAGAHVKTTMFTRRPRPVLFGALARAGLAGVTAGLILAGGTAAGAFSPMAPAAFASAASSAQEADQTAPAAPAGLAAIASVGKVTVSWAASDGATSYDVYAGTTDSFQSSTKLITVRGLGYTAAGLTNGTRYYFWVTAANGSGTSSPSSVASTPLALRGTEPGAPVRLTATASQGQGQVTLSWVAPASSGVSPITGYDIYVGSTQAFRGGQPQFVSQGPGTSYVVKGLSAGATYYFQVSAVSAQGSGPASGAASATLEPVAKPTVLGAPGNVIAQPGRSRVIVLWTAPATTSGAKISGYLVYAGTRPGGESSTPVSPALIHYTATAVMGLSSSTKYYFKVAAVDSTGQRGALSAEVSAVPWPAVGPGSPAGPQSPPASQTASPVQTSPDQQLSTVPSSQTAGPTQGQSSPGTPAGLIILLAAVAVAALTGAVALAVHYRRTRIRPATSEAFQPGESEAFQPGERDRRPDAMSGPRYR
jgi:predicted phage tail protein